MRLEQCKFWMPYDIYLISYAYTAVTYYQHYLPTKSYDIEVGQINQIWRQSGQSGSSAIGQMTQISKNQWSRVHFDLSAHIHAQLYK